MFSIFERSLIWFGCAVSVSEILTGTSFASLGFRRGLLAIIIGHVIGGIFLFLSGLVGARSSKNAMETTAISFGSSGAKFFAFLNVLQLVGWTGILIFDASHSVQEIFSATWAKAGFWAVVMGALMIVWILIGTSGLRKINVVAVTSLFVLTLLLSYRIFSSSPSSIPSVQAISFGQAVELAAAMPLSWIPVISDFTNGAKKPRATAFFSTLTYSLVSVWMYVIGMGAAIFTDETNIALVFAKLGLGVAGLLVIVVSTVTTNYIAVYSAGISCRTLTSRIGSKQASVIATVLGTLGAVFLPLFNIEGFLFYIGSVFTPMAAVIAADFFVLRKDSSAKKFDWVKIACWLLGFVFYRFIMRFDFILGCSVLDFAFTFAVVLATRIFAGKKL